VGLRTVLKGSGAETCSQLPVCGCRFVCREQLGGDKQPAGYLTPVPENSVVYGSGSSSVILTKVHVTTLQSCHPAHIYIMRAASSG
jgi:hypothetical protein